MPADRDALLALADRVEREEPSADLWREAFDAVNPMPSGMIGFADWAATLARFMSLVRNNALRDAAAMLMPIGHALHILERADGAMMVEAIGADDEGVQSVVTGPHAMARAWMAANLRARAQEADHG